MKIRSAVVVASSIVFLVGLTACSSGSGGSGSGSGGSGSSAVPAKTAAAKTYSADDLASILKTTQTKLGVSGKIMDNAAVQSSTDKLNAQGGIASLLSQKGVMFSPASCASQFTAATQMKPPADSVASSLTYGTSTIALVTENNKALDAKYTTGGQDRIDALLKGCTDMKITVKPAGSPAPVTVDLKLAKSAVATDADQTFGFDETVSVPGAGDEKITSVTAIQGNLVISGTAVGESSIAGAPTPSADAPSLSDAVNAVLAAAK